MRDETDRSVVDTALRECEEEIQLQRDVVKVTSVLPSLKVYQKTLYLTPVICTVPPNTFATYHFTPNPTEVADIFHVPLATFLSETEPPLRSHSVDHPYTSFDLHHFNVEFEGKEFDVQGITAHLCVVIAAIGLGRSPTFEYKLPNEYCVVSDEIRNRVDRIICGL
ncbi:hypothetical protein ACHWQZ_G014191 [Mnemiopsis leidyi]